MSNIELLLLLFLNFLLLLVVRLIYTVRRQQRALQQVYKLLREAQQSRSGIIKLLCMVQYLPEKGRRADDSSCNPRAEQYKQMQEEQDALSVLQQKR